MKDHNECLNPDCKRAHAWIKRTEKDFEVALCEICRIQMTSIMVYSDISYKILRGFLLEEFKKK